MTDIVLFGAGGHAREVAQLIADINQAQPGCWNLVGFVADPGTTPGAIAPEHQEDTQGLAPRGSQP